MYAIVFDLKIEELEKHYRKSYDGAYTEISKELEMIGLEQKQSGLYVTKNNTNSITTLYKAINKLSSIAWFKSSVRNIKAFKVEDWSDFTEVVKT